MIIISLIFFTFYDDIFLFCFSTIQFHWRSWVSIFITYKPEGVSFYMPPPPIQTGIKIVRFINYNSRIRNVVTFSIRSARTTFKMLKLHQINRMKWLNQMIQTSVQKREMLEKHRNLEKPTVNIF